MAPHRRVTLASIARASGVSVTTVSKVLNGHRDVADPTRQKVEAQLQRQGYRRRPRPGDPDLIHLVVGDLRSEWGMEIVAGVVSLASEHDMGVVLVPHTDGGPDPATNLLRLASRHPPVGVVLALAGPRSPLATQLDARGVPCVVVDPMGDCPPGVPSVGAANWAGGLAAARHVISLGHRRIAVIAGPETAAGAAARLDGFRSALQGADVPLGEGCVRFSAFTVEAGYRHTRSLLSLDPAPTAIVTGNDLQAVGAIQAVRAHGLRVPEDVSIVGFDDLSFASLVFPALTTVRQPLRQMGYEAASLSMRMRSGHAPVPVHVHLATTLVVRESTGPPNTGPEMLTH